jgi:aryl-alcohol dehydrogenase-like predicted oxidoreductase
MTGIILGTANLSNNYGLIREKVESGDFYNGLIKSAIELGINRFDTAIGYGNSEVTLGNAIESKIGLKIDTKINPINFSHQDEILDEIRASLQRLKIEQIETIYIHDSNILKTKKNDLVTSSLLEAKALGLVNKIGISIYEEDELNLIQTEFKIANSIQVPENICDRRLINNPKLYELAENGVELNVRSVFLQGLLTMNSNNLPSSLRSAHDSILSLEKFSRVNGISSVDICIAYAKSIQWATNIIIGTNSIQQLKQVLESKRKLTSYQQDEIIKLPPDLVDPRKWIL